MGILLDTIEDNAERESQFIDQISVDLPTPLQGIEVVGPPLIECPVCGEPVISKDNLDQHIIISHANQHVYVRANNAIVRGLAYLKEPPETLEVVPLGINSARLEIEITGSHAKTIEFSERISLMPYVRGLSSGEIHLRIYFEEERGPREFSIFVHAIPEFRLEFIDRDALKFLFLPLNLNQEPNFSDFAPHRQDESYPQQRYANGLHDYALGYYLLKTGGQAKSHLETALSLLAPFKTKAAITARRVLALRMNLFKFLCSCGPSSRFAVAKLFFNQQEARFESEGQILNGKWSHEEYGIYIDRFTEIFLDSLNAYYSKEYQMLDQLCQHLEELLPRLDRNNRDKLILLYARTAKKRNDSVSCRRHYQMLLHHPDFGNEATEML